MSKLANRAKMTTATTGTGTITLGSAVAGYQSLAAAGVANGNVVSYVIEDGTNWEIGSGTYAATGTTLSRSPSQSSSGGAAISLSGNATVYVAAIAADLQELVDFADRFSLPTADGTSGQVLTTNGSGVLTFQSAGGGSVTGQTDSATPFETSLGTGAGAVNTGVNNTFVGFEAGNDNTTGTDNTAVGFRALDVVVSGSRNTAMGSNALGAATGSDNVAIGTEAALAHNVSEAVAVGYRALYTPDTFTGAVAIGYRAMGFGPASSTGGRESVAIGSDAGQSLNGSSSVAVGHQALLGNFTSKITGVQNIGVGYRAGYSLSSGGTNTFVGQQAGFAVTTGSNNVAIGNGALDTATTGGVNIAIGQDAMGTSAATAAAGYNVAIGSTAGGRITSGADNIAIGQAALFGGTAGVSGGYNVSLGFLSGNRLTSGSNNIFCGQYAGYAVTTGANNVAIGNGALDASTTGGRNVAIGQDAMGLGVATTANGYNVAVGYQAAQSITSAVDMVAIGAGALASSTTGTGCVALGTGALGSHTTGYDNVAVGRGAGSNITDGYENITIGTSAQTSSASGGGQIVIGNYLTGQGNACVTIGDNIGKIYANFRSSAAWTQTSDQTVKNVIGRDTLGLSFVERLNPVLYTWKPQDELPADHPHYSAVNEKDTAVVMHGLIAQEVKAALDAEGCSTFSGWSQGEDGLQGVSREAFVIPLILAVQELSSRVRDLEAKLEALK